jgi:hypothetical protein
LQVKAILSVAICVMLTGCASNTYRATPHVKTSIVPPVQNSVTVVPPIFQAKSRSTFGYSVEKKYVKQERRARRDQIYTIWGYDIQQDKQYAKTCFNPVLPVQTRVQTRVQTQEQAEPSSLAQAPLVNFGKASGSAWKYVNGNYIRVRPHKKSSVRKTSGIGDCMNSFSDKLAEQKSQLAYLHAPNQVVSYLQNAHEWATTCSVSGRKSKLCIGSNTLSALRDMKEAAKVAISEDLAK